MSIVVILSLYYKLVFCTCLVWQLRAQFASNEYGSRREREHKKHGKKINRKLRKIQKNKLQSSRGGGSGGGTDALTLHVVNPGEKPGSIVEKRVHFAHVNEPKSKV